MRLNIPTNVAANPAFAALDDCEKIAAYWLIMHGQPINEAIENQYDAVNVELVGAAGTSLIEYNGAVYSLINC